ncbi:uncharacterized protein [Choristoneura fumiferana]|uniref:uncharacterized protein n=1 Tax=Choristoneura fumiferana TaxID=7141 RepID=UPI003D15CDB7
MKIESLFLVFATFFIDYVVGKSVVPVLTLDPNQRILAANKTVRNRKRQADKHVGRDTFLPFVMLVNKDSDTSEYWRETEILSLVKNNEEDIDFERCAETPIGSIVHFPSRRTLRPICRSRIDFQLCPQCAHFSNSTECELFRDSCKYNVFYYVYIKVETSKGERPSVVLQPGGRKVGHALGLRGRAPILAEQALRCDGTNSGSEPQNPVGLPQLIHHQFMSSMKSTSVVVLHEQPGRPMVTVKDNRALSSLRDTVSFIHTAANSQ